jgi:hypothetical protein
MKRKHWKCLESSQVSSLPCKCVTALQWCLAEPQELLPYVTTCFTERRKAEACLHNIQVTDDTDEGSE